MSEPAPLRRYVIRMKLPDERLYPNYARRGWHGKWKAAQEARSTAATTAVAVLAEERVRLGLRDDLPPMKRIRVELRFRFCSGQTAYDVDSCESALKATLDGLRCREEGDPPMLFERDSWLGMPEIAASVERCVRGCSCGGYAEITLVELPLPRGWTPWRSRSKRRA